MKRAIHIIVEGLVQGVFFRAYTNDAAKQFNISGWVRNIGEGRVECEAYGDRANISMFLTALRKGPAVSRVDNLVITDLELSNKYNSFKILPTK